MEILVCCNNLRALIASSHCASIMLRLAWHDAGTHDVKTKTGGPNGSIRNAEEYSHGSNNGLKKAIDWPIAFAMTMPLRMYVPPQELAGVAVEVTGGPTIDCVPGRKDSMFVPGKGNFQMLSKMTRGYKNLHSVMGVSSGMVAFAGASAAAMVGTAAVVERLWAVCRGASISLTKVDLWECWCASGAPHLRDIFYWMGLSDKDIVALSGGHTLGRAHPERSGFDGPWTKEPLKFDNSYIVELLEGESEGLLRLPTDKALVDDPNFRHYVDLYAKDEEALFRDYAESHKKLSELGFAPISSGSKVISKESSILAQSAVGVAVAAAVVILSYFYEVHKNIK